MKHLLLLSLLALSACADHSAIEPADMVLLDGNVITVDQALGLQQAIAVTGDTIVAVGNNMAIRQHIGEATTVINLAGKTVIPGLIEGHGHFLSLGRVQQVLDLSSATSYEQILLRVGAAVDKAEPGEWIFGMGWHQDKWQDSPEPSVDGVPTHASLSALSPDNPVLLNHASGHAAFANARALDLAGITGSTPDPAGGTLVRDTSGQATGLLRETAQRLVLAAAQVEQDKLSPEARNANIREQITLAGQAALSYGITSFHDAGADFNTLAFFREQIGRAHV